MATGAELATAWVRIVPSFKGGAAELSKELDPAAEKAGTQAGGKMSDGMKKSMAAGAAAVVAATVAVFNVGFKELKFGEEINAQTDLLVKNTGFKMKTDEINDYTLALSRISGISEEELQQAGNTIIKFGDISEENYKKAVDSINDLGASGKDVAGTSEALGKALADPAQAASLLRRQGVILNAEQQTMIDKFIESGDKAGAQGVILDALQDTYSGMAETVGETMTGKLNKMQNSFENVAGTLVEVVLPALDWLVGGLSVAADWMEKNPALVQILAGVLGLLAAAFVGITIATWAMNTALLANPITWIVLAIVAVIALLVAAAVWLASNWDAVMKAIGDAMTWVWETILEPVFNAIGDIFTWLWTYIIKPIVDLIVNYFRLWAAVFAWLYENGIKPVIDLLADVFTWLYENIIKPVWDGIQQTISTVWNWIDQYVFTPFKLGIDLLGKAFESTAKAIGTAWEAIKKAAAAPINFVLDTVWNNGLRSFWNGLVDGLGLKDMKLPEAKLIKFAEGSENHVAQIARPGEMRLWAEPETGGEAYIPLAQSKRGRSTAILSNVAQRFGFNLTRFASGGVFGDTIDGLVNPFMAGQNVFGRLPGALLQKAIKTAVDMFIGGGGGTGGGPTLARVQSMLGGTGLRITSTYRSPAENRAAGGASNSYHMDKANPAVDIAGSTASMNAFALRLANAGPWRELLYNNVRAPGIRFWPGHYDHVHVAENGGIVPGLAGGGTVTKSGWTVVGESGPELLNLPRGAEVDPDFDSTSKVGTTVVFKNYAPLGQSPAQALTQFANRARGQGVLK